MRNARFRWNSRLCEYKKFGTIGFRMQEIIGFNCSTNRNFEVCLFWNVQIVGYITYYSQEYQNFWDNVSNRLRKIIEFLFLYLVDKIVCDIKL